MPRYSWLIGFLVIGTMGMAQPWQRNTFPGRGHYDHGYPAGWGWDHTEANQDLEVSPLNPDFMAYVDNEWSAVLSADGVVFEPIQMPYIGGGDCKIEDLEFSGEKDSTLYIILGHAYWRSLPNDLSKAGIWRSRDLGTTWEHIYRLPDGAYERYGNYPEGTHLLEDPHPERGHHLYFGTTSHGIVRSIDGGNSWENAVPALSGRCIKMMDASREGNETWIYAIAEKRMPVHETGNMVPLDTWGPSDYTEMWSFDHTLNGKEGNGLSGNVAFWPESCAEGTHSVALDGSGSGLAIQGMNYAGSYSVITVSAWVKTTRGDYQAIASFDKEAYWELGINGTGADSGKATWIIKNSAGRQFILTSASRLDDGDWHHVAGVWDKGKIRIYVDGEQEDDTVSETSDFGSGAARFGYLGAGSHSETFGDGQTVPDSYFQGLLDEVRIYKNRGLNRNQYRGIYLENNHKYPVAQGSLWRIRISSDGSIAEAVRLHNGKDDFVYLEPNPRDPSTGWVIRKARPKSWPYGGREVYRYSDYGEVLHLTPISEGSSDGLFSIHTHPVDTSFIFLRCGGDLRYALRYSADGGNIWHGNGRDAEEDMVPSIQPWNPSSYKYYGKGLPAGAGGQPRGTDITLVPGSPGEVLYINAVHGLFRSPDFGATFTAFGGGGSNKDLGQLAVAPGDPDCWATTSFEFGFKHTSNGGLFWEGEGHMNNGLLENLSKQSEAAGQNWTFSRTGVGIAYHPFDAHQLVATYTKQGYIILSGDGGMTWAYTGVNTGEASNVFWCSSDTRRIYAGNKRSNDGGRSWEDIGKHVVAVSETNPDLVVGLRGIERDITAHSLGMYLSLDGGTNWVSLPTPPREMVPGTSSRWNITTTSRIFGLMAMDLIAIDPSPGHDPSIDPENRVRLLMAGRSGIYEYIATNEDGSGFASNWQINATGLDLNRHYSQFEPVPWMGFVAFDPRPGYAHVVYASKTNDWQTMDDWYGEANKNHNYPGGDNLEPFYMSRDGGITWMKMHGEEFRDAPVSAMVHSLEVDSYGRFYAATCEGIYHVAVEGIASTPPEERYRIDFTVLDNETGDPIPGCRIDLDSISVFTNEKGIVGIDGREAGPYSVSVSADGYDSANMVGIELTSDTSLLFTLLNRSHTVSVLVLDHSTGDPVSRARVTCDGQMEVTSIPGEVMFDRIESGTKLLTLEHPDFFTWSDSVSLNSDTLLVIWLTGTLSNVIFQVEDAGAPVNNASVTLNSVTLATDHSGFVLFPNRQAREWYTFTVAQPDYLQVRDTFFLENDTILHISLVSATGVNKLNEVPGFRVYPNPVEDLIYLYVPVSESLLKVVDLHGRVQRMQQTDPGWNRLDLSSLSRGCYFLQVSSPQEERWIELVIRQ